MLKLNNIVKNYTAGDAQVSALKGISLEFRKSEFVSVLGPSGCGKTTLLNIIGGLDRYTSGDMYINGVSTKKYRDSDWDAYRNHSIGFVFQSYNLIPHQTVLANVELALTLSGVSKAERRRRAKEVLARVGLEDQINKKPSQMSGGQMQRVAIARALVNNPDILLADEPTGALDSETSVQIMDILKEISKDRLIIMVTHNPELAQSYSTRLIRLLDGRVIGDSDPFLSGQEEPAQNKAEAPAKKIKKPSMSFFTALSLSLNNLMTKKARTFMTSFAGSIGIIGIALILALSSGFQNYINRVQRDTLSSYPIAIEQETADMAGMMMAVMESRVNKAEHDKDKVYSSNIMGDMLNAMVKQVKTNNLTQFKKYLDSSAEIQKYASEIQYGYGLELNIYTPDISSGIIKVNPSDIFESFYGDSAQAMGMNTSMNIWEELPGNKEMLYSQYDVIAGSWPQAYNEAVLIVDENNEITDFTLYALGLKDQKELEKMMQAAMKGETYETETSSFTYDELLNLSFKLVINSDYYVYDGQTGLWQDKREDQVYLAGLVEKGTDIKICGIIRPAEGAVSTAMAGAVGYTSELAGYVMDKINSSPAAQAQKSSPETDIFTGFPFDRENRKVTMEMVQEYIASLPEEQRVQVLAYLEGKSEEEIIAVLTPQIMPETQATYESNLSLIGVTDKDSPKSVNIYAADFEAKEELERLIAAYNADMTAQGREENVIQYTDYVGIMMQSVSTIIDTIAYVLIAFVAISLIVSSIMIGIITYISVLERTKEIGILRSIGASKRDVSRVFNAETLIVGFAAGLLGILMTLLLTIPVNIIINALAEIPDVASLPAAGALILIVISMLLTFIAGLIPARAAARKDPVEALRTE